MDSPLNDLRYATRALRRSPIFTATAVLTLSLGVGANTAIFSVVRGLLLKPPPYTEPDRLVALRLEGPRFPLPFNKRELVRTGEEVRSLEVSAYRVQNEAVVSDGDSSLLMGNAGVSAGLFPMLGVAPFLGRGFEGADSTPSAEKVAVLSHRLWRSAFGADPDAIGRRLSIADGRYTSGVHAIVGVMPPGFRFPDETVDVWVPIPLDPLDQSDYRARSANLRMLGRLSDEVGVDAAAAELTAFLRAMYGVPPERERPIVTVTPFREFQIGEYRTQLLLLLGVTGFVLLIASINLASLFSARLESQRVTVAIRAALGARHWGLARLTLSEGLLVGLVGTLVGYGMARLSLGLLVSTLPEGIQNLGEIELDWRIFLFSLALSLASTVAAAVAPAFKSAWTSPVSALASSRTSTSSPGGLVVRRSIVVLELALVVPLIVAASLMTKSLWLLGSQEHGIEPESVVTFRLDSRRPTMELQNQYYERVLARLRGLPGVTDASVVRGMPFLNAGSQTNATFPHDPSLGGERGVLVDYQVVHSGFFATLGIPLVAGRDFELSDTEASAPVAVVNRALAERFFDGSDPVGRRIVSGGDREIVGVFENSRRRLDTRPEPLLYVPYSQIPNARGTRRVLVRMAAAPDARGAAADHASRIDWLRKEITAIDSSVAISDSRTMYDVLSSSLATERGMARLLALFAGLALILGVVGLYGTLAQFVSRRSREMGIRIALGAERLDVLRTVTVQGMGLVVMGLALGLLAARALGRLMSSLLFDVEPSDPAMLILTCAVLVSAALTAIVVPSIRASRVDPLAVLRNG